MRLTTVAAGAAIIGGAFVLGSCATPSLTADQCLAGNWGSIGYEDGRAGYGHGRLDQHAEACAEHGVTPDANAYFAAMTQGRRLYCTPANGFRVAAGGGGYSNGFCAADLEQDFLYAYADGRLVWDAVSRVNELRENAQRHRNQAAENERDIRAEEQRLQNEQLTDEQRRAIRERINRLRRDRDNALGQADYLNNDIQAAEREVSRIRSRFIPVYGNW